MRVTPSQTAKSDTVARPGIEKRYSPSSTPARWLAKICRTETRASPLSMRMSTAISIEREDRRIRGRRCRRESARRHRPAAESAPASAASSTSQRRRLMAGSVRARCRCRHTDGRRRRTSAVTFIDGRPDLRSSSSAGSGGRTPAALSTACRRRHGSSVTAIALGLISIGPLRSAKRCQRPFASRRKSPPP